MRAVHVLFELMILPALLAADPNGDTVPQCAVSEEVQPPSIHQIQCHPMS